MSKSPNAVPLLEPIKIDGKEVTEISLRKPKAGELRGLKVTDVLQMDVSAMMVLLPRITQPPMDGAQVADLDPADFTALSTKAVTFFVKKDQMQGVMAGL